MAPVTIAAQFRALLGARRRGTSDLDVVEQPTGTGGGAVEDTARASDDRGVVNAVEGGEVPSAVTWLPLGSALLIGLAGAIDVASGDLLEAALAAVTCGITRTLVDLSDVTFFGGVGLNFLSRLVASGVAVQLIGVPAALPIGRELQAAGIHRIVVH